MSSSTAVTVIVRTAHETRRRRIRAWAATAAVSGSFVVALVWEPLDFLWH